MSKTIVITGLAILALIANARGDSTDFAIFATGALMLVGLGERNGK